MATATKTKAAAKPKATTKAKAATATKTKAATKPKATTKAKAATATKTKAAAKPKAATKAKAATTTKAKATAKPKAATKAKAATTTKAKATAKPKAAAAPDAATEGTTALATPEVAATPAAPRPARSKKREKIAPDRLAMLCEAAVKSLEDDKAENIVVLDVTGRADYADRLIIATGLVERQLQAMAMHLDEALGEAGLNLRRDSIQASPDWVLIDAGDLVIHLFRPEARELYRLERMWGPESPPAGSPTDVPRD